MLRPVAFDCVGQCSYFLRYNIFRITNSPGSRSTPLFLSIDFHRSLSISPQIPPQPPSFPSPPPPSSLFPYPRLPLSLPLSPPLFSLFTNITWRGRCMWSYLRGRRFRIRTKDPPTETFQRVESDNFKLTDASHNITVIIISYKI